MKWFNSQFVRIVNKYGTAVNVTDNNELKVASTVTASATARTIAISRNTNTTGTVAEGANSVSFFNAGSDDCTVDSVVLAAGEVVTFDAPGGDFLQAIAWEADTSAGSVMLITAVI